MATYTNTTKNTTTYTNVQETASNDELLMESSDFLLQENGDKIILEQDSAGQLVAYTNTSKS